MGLILAAGAVILVYGLFLGVLVARSFVLLHRDKSPDWLVTLAKRLPVKDGLADDGDEDHGNVDAGSQGENDAEQNEPVQGGIEAAGGYQRMSRNLPKGSTCCEESSPATGNSEVTQEQELKPQPPDGAPSSSQGCAESVSAVQMARIHLQQAQDSQPLNPNPTTSLLEQTTVQRSTSCKGADLKGKALYGSTGTV